VSGSKPEPATGRERRRTTLAARGEPLIWLLGAGQVVASLMILGLLLFVLIKGFATFWPKSVELVETKSGTRYLGEITRTDSFRPVQSDAGAKAAEAVDRRLVRTGNFDLYGDDFKWVLDEDIAASTQPADAVTIERLEWGNFFGFVEEYHSAGQTVAADRAGAWSAFESRHDAVRELWHQVNGLERNELGEVFAKINALRLSLRRVELEHGKSSAEYAAAVAEADRERTGLKAQSDEIAGRIATLRARMEEDVLVLSEIGGVRKELPVYAVVRAYQANRLTLISRLGIYFSRWWEFMSDEPRESNTEGGVFPAIFGTVLMTLIMALAVTPFGVMAALYLREYAKQGFIVSAVRIAVNNLAGVPSIVFGVFGLGFFCYLVGGTIDSIFYPEYAPSPKFGTPGLLWASLTLALLTLPVVIVATEEALAAVPRSLREAGYACGASKWQVIRMVVLPKAMPGIMTGIILAMARGAGEVAPLMLTGVVKLAPELPVSGDFPFIHFERSIMHLGFHIYDLGFQSRNAEAAKPMVFTTTLLLICVIVLMNVFVISVRTRLKRKLSSGYF